MHQVHLADMSKAVLSKLRNGHPVRAMLGAKGSGVGAILSEDNLKKLMKAGKRGAKAVIKLGADELHANRSGGTGIMSGGKFSFKHAAKSVNKGLKKVAGNPIVQDVVSQTAGDLAAAAAPELGPLGYAGAAYGAKKGMQAYAGSGVGGALGHPEHVGGKFKMKKLGKHIKNIASNKHVQDLAFKGANMAMDAAMAGGEGFHFHGPMQHTGARVPVSSMLEGQGGKIKMKKVGKAFKNVVSNKHVQDIALKGAKMAMEAAMAGGEGLYASGGKLKMKHIGHAIKHIASNKHVQDLAFKAAQMGMEAAAASGEGLTSGGKLKMKHIGHAIKHIASNKKVQDLAFKAANMAMDAAASGEGLYASGRGQLEDALSSAYKKFTKGTRPSGASGDASDSDSDDGTPAMDAGAKQYVPPSRRPGQRSRRAVGKPRPTGNGFVAGSSVKRKVVDLIEDIGENRPRKRGESRVRQAIDLVERMRKPGGRGFVAGGAIGSSADLTSITNVGAGGNLLCMRNPALRSQADSSNFFFHTEFPPELAERMEGSGIYA